MSIEHGGSGIINNGTAINPAGFKILRLRFEELEEQEHPV